MYISQYGHNPLQIPQDQVGNVCCYVPCWHSNPLAIGHKSCLASLSFSSYTWWLIYICKYIL